ncbi:MAG TPA: Lrp/AsnC ligand binding domain-containing protein [Nitrososphaera sp.]|nr:Lrp/AsnC ligand binding domain-containing protein [Nitrososphaera sp.]
MSKAFVFLNCDIGAEKGIISQMRGILGVSRANGVSGIYDIVAEVNADSQPGIAQIVKKLRSIASIRSCLTMMVVAEKSAVLTSPMGHGDQ